MKNGNLFLPLEKIRSMNPVFATCMRTIYINKSELVEGENSLEGVKDTFSIGIDKKDNSAELLSIDMEELRKKTCPEDTFKIVGISIFVIVIIIGCLIGFVCFMKMRKVKNEEEPNMEKNEEYNVDDDYYYTEFDNRGEDANDYYK